MQDQAYPSSVYVSDCIVNDRREIMALMSNYNNDFLAGTGVACL